MPQRLLPVPLCSPSHPCWLSLCLAMTPAPQKQPPSTHMAQPGDLLRCLQVPFLPTKQRKKGKKCSGERRGLTTPGLARDHNVLLGWGTPPRACPDSQSLPAAAHEVAQEQAQQRGHRQRHQQRHQVPGQQVPGGHLSGGLEIPPILQHPGTPHWPWRRGAGTDLQLQGGTVRGTGVPGGRRMAGALTRVRLHQRTAKRGAKVS